ncbi:MAG: hypothetical protein K5656_11990 [Lachnospiraceae bacterium]|nr:hypothetical protein [Lachnospiraceae bacterium]
MRKIKTNLLVLFVVLIAFLASFQGVHASIAKPKKPSVKVVKTLEGKVKIKWASVKNADKYQIYRSSKSNSGYKCIATRKKCYYVDKKAKARVKYYYKVRGVNYETKVKIKKNKTDDVTSKDASSSNASSSNAELTKASYSLPTNAIAGKMVSKKTKYDKATNTIKITRKYIRYGKYSKAKSIYVEPKNARVVILGECYATGIASSARDLLPSNYHVVYKTGINSLGIMTRNCISYNGTLISPIERAAYYNPDRIYILVGMNECKNGNSRAATSNFYKSYSLLKRINPNIKMILMAVTPVGLSSPLNIPSLSKRLAWNAQYKSYAAKHSGIYYYDYTKPLNNGKGYINSRYGAGDGCHWNTAGTRLVTKNLVSWDKKKFES